MSPAAGSRQTICSAPPSRERSLDMTMTDLGPATERLCALIEAVPDAALGRFARPWGW